MTCRICKQPLELPFIQGPEHRAHIDCYLRMWVLHDREGMTDRLVSIINTQDEPSAAAALN